MSFRLKNAPTIFSRVVVEAFKEFLHKFLEAYFDDWTVFSLLKNHIECLRHLLALCNLPKAAEAITEVTSNHFESWI
jgi:hypothetical protein